MSLGSAINFHLFNAPDSWLSTSMLVAKGSGLCLSLLYSCTLLYETTSTPTTASPTLQLPQYPLPTYTAALANSPTLVFDKNYGTTLPSAITNLTSNEWPDPPFSAGIPGFTDGVLNFLTTGREGTFLQRVVLENIVQAQLIQWSREQSTYMPAVFPPLSALLTLQPGMAESTISLPLRSDEKPTLEVY